MLLLLTACAPDGTLESVETGTAECVVLDRFGRDRDGDGWGDPADVRLGCTAPEGYVPDETDCDDADPDTHPGAPEPCGSRVDHDCDGIIAEQLTVGADARWFGLGEEFELGEAVAAVGSPSGPRVAASVRETDDFRFGGVVWIDPALDGEGLGPDASILGSDDGRLLDLALVGGRFAGPASAPADALVVGDYDEALGENTGGAVFVFDLSTTDTKTPRTVLDAALTLYRGDTQGYFGGALALGGDADGDGAEDLIVGVAYTSEAPLWVVATRATGVYAAEELAVPIGGEVDAYEGVQAVAWLGDLDGDGLDDLGAGGPLYGGGNGRVWVLHGPITDGRSLADADVVFVPEVDEIALLGWALAGGGDYDGDGGADLVLGAPGQASPGGGEGVVTVHRGGTGLGVDGPWATFDGGAEAWRLGEQVGWATLADDDRGAVFVSDPGLSSDVANPGLYLFACTGPGLWGGEDARVVVRPGGPIGGGLAAVALPDGDGDGASELALGLSLTDLEDDRDVGAVEVVRSAAWR